MTQLDVWDGDVRVGHFTVPLDTDLYIEWQDVEVIPAVIQSQIDMAFHSHYDFLGLERRRHAEGWRIRMFYAAKGHYTFVPENCGNISLEDPHDRTVDLRPS